MKVDAKPQLAFVAGFQGHIAEKCLNHKLKGAEGLIDNTIKIQPASKSLHGLQWWLYVAIIGERAPSCFEFA